MASKYSMNDRPSWPRRAIVTAGEPYGNKGLHFGHVGGVFVPADFFARFLRDRLGRENVIFTSGTDCYGSPIMESYRKLKEFKATVKSLPRPAEATLDDVEEIRSAQRTYEEIKKNSDLYESLSVAETRKMDELIEAADTLIWSDAVEKINAIGTVTINSGDAINAAKAAVSRLSADQMKTFPQELLDKLAAKGVKEAYITLHVGLGTFRPVKEDEIEDHPMHSEFCIIPEETARIITETKRAGGRIVCVGTTSCRTVESFANEDGTMDAQSGWTNIFIYPGYKFKCLDALITNFHLPESTLIMLVSALAGREHVLAAYKEAVEKRYRFFSFGDAMFIS